MHVICGSESHGMQLVMYCSQLSNRSMTNRSDLVQCLGGWETLTQQTKHRQGTLLSYWNVGEYGRNAASLVQAYLGLTYMF